jgi:hypothetical protein
VEAAKTTGAAVLRGGGGAPVDGGKSGVLLRLREDEGKVKHPRI